MKKIIVKMIYDVILTVMMLLLMVYSFTGGFVHELLGIGIIVLFIVHKIINIKWIKNVSKKIFVKKCDGLTTAKYITNVVLLILFVVTGVSGVLVSNNILIGISAGNRAVWVYIHNLSAYLLLIVISIHVGLHWSFIMASVRRMFHITKDSRLRRIILRVMAGILAVLGIRAHFDEDFLRHFVPSDNNEKSENGRHEKNGSQKNKVKDEPEDESEDRSEDESEDESQKSKTDKKRPHKNKGKNDNQLIQISDNQSETTQTPTLEEYLEKLRCTGCGKNCLLISPQCGRGSMQAKEAEEKYYELYGIEEGETDDNKAADNVTDSESRSDKKEIIFEADNANELEEIFKTMIPVMSLYIGGTYYVIKFRKKESV